MREARRGPAVLVVDDEPDVVDSLEALLRAHFADVNVTTAASGPEAIDLLQHGTFDLTLCDFRMPGMDGLELLSDVARRSPRTSRILMTAYADLDLAVRSVNEGHVDFFLRKPVDADDVLESVARGLAKSLDDQERDRILSTQAKVGHAAARLLRAPDALDAISPKGPGAAGA